MKEVVIKKEDSNQRIDKFVRKYLNDAPLSFIYKTFRKKDVKINGKRVKENYILQENDVLRIYITDEQIAEFNKPVDVTKVDIKGNLNIIYEDENILILNKPKGILVHGDINEIRRTLSNQVLYYLHQKGEFRNDGLSYVPSPTHRLDRNTSGIIVFAKNFISSKEMMDLFKDHENIKKTYLLLVFGKLNEKEGEINAPLLKDEKSGFVKVASLKDGAKSAKTLYKVIAENDKYSLVEATLITGRTHQLRVHFAYIGNPIVGDEKYGNFKRNDEFIKKFDYKNQFLIAYKLQFKNVEGQLSYLSNRVFKTEISDKENNILSKIFAKTLYFWKKLFWFWTFHENLTSFHSFHFLITSIVRHYKFLSIHYFTNAKLQFNKFLIY